MPRLRSIQPRLHIAEFDRALAFYRDVLGFEVTGFDEEDPPFALLTRDGVGIQIGGPEAMKLQEEQPTVTLYIDVDDARAMHEALKGKVAIEWGPEVYFYGRREFALRDPDGHLIIISEETDDPPTSSES